MELFASDPRFGKLRIINVSSSLMVQKSSMPKMKAAQLFLYTGLVTKKLSKTGM